MTPTPNHTPPIRATAWDLYAAYGTGGGFVATLAGGRVAWTDAMVSRDERMVRLARLESVSQDTGNGSKHVMRVRETRVAPDREVLVSWTEDDGEALRESIAANGRGTGEGGN